MKNLETYKKQLKEIEALIDKLEKGQLSLDELVSLEKLTGELHAKSIILKYKAFESHVHGETPKVEESQPVEKEVVEEKQEEAPALEFAIFDDIADDEPVAEEEPAPFEIKPEVVEPEPQIVEPIESKTEEPVVEEKPEPIVVHLDDPEDSTPIEEKTETPAADLSFWEKINIEDNSLGSQFADAKLDTLVGAFGLNQKLRYINDLFDGSSELFSDAIKILDSQADLDAARAKVGELASEHSWDSEEESVAEFLSFVNRRYA